MVRCQCDRPDLAAGRMAPGAGGRGRFRLCNLASTTSKRILVSGVVVGVAAENAPRADRWCDMRLQKQGQVAPIAMACHQIPGLTELNVNARTLSVESTITASQGSVRRSPPSCAARHCVAAVQFVRTWSSTSRHLSPTIVDDQGTRAVGGGPAAAGSGTARCGVSTTEPDGGGSH
jgi:hypothetical protein